MPSQRFYRLPEEKQALICKASMKEFISVPYEKISINKIIREAGISRGSFYTYFEDKEDLLSFLLEDTRKKWGECCRKTLAETEGDLCCAMEALLEYGMDFCKNNNIFRLHRNLVMYPDGVLTERVEEDFDFEQAIGEDFFGRVDRSRLRDGTERGVILLVKLCTICMMAAFTEYYRHPEKEDLIKEEYKKALRILCRGAYKDPQREQQKDQMEEKVDE